MKNKLLIRALSALSVTMAFTACRVALETDLQNAYESTTRRSSGAQMVLVATMETPEGETKTTLSGSQVLWKAGDQIKIFDSGTGSVTLTLAPECDGQAVGEFPGTILLGSGPYYAVYPASAAVSRSSNNLSINIPQEQTLTADSFGNGNNIAVAKIASLDDALHFKNVLGAVCIQLSSSITATRVRIQTKGTEYLCGSGTVDMSGDVPSLSIATGTTDNQIVEANGSASGTAFYLMLPPNALANGFITQVAAGSNAMLKEAPASESNKITRSGIVAMPELAFVNQVPSSFLDISAAPFGYWASFSSPKTFTFSMTTSQFASKVGTVSRTCRMQDFSTGRMYSFELSKAPALGLSGEGYAVMHESVEGNNYTSRSPLSTNFHLVQKTSNAGWFVSSDNTKGFIISLED